MSSVKIRVESKRKSNLNLKRAIVRTTGRVSVPTIKRNRRLAIVGAESGVRVGGMNLLEGEVLLNENDLVCDQQYLLRAYKSIYDSEKNGINKAIKMLKKM